MASFTTNLDLNVNNKLPEEGGRTKDVLKVSKDKEPSWMSSKDEGPTWISSKDKDSTLVTPKDNWSNFNISSWPGKRSSKSEEPSKNELKTRNQLVWGNKKFTVYLAVHKKIRPSTQILKFNRLSSSTNDPVFVIHYNLNDEIHHDTHTPSSATVDVVLHAAAQTEGVVTSSCCPQVSLSVIQILNPVVILVMIIIVIFVVVVVMFVVVVVVVVVLVVVKNHYQCAPRCFSRPLEVWSKHNQQLLASTPCPGFSLLCNF